MNRLQTSLKNLPFSFDTDEKLRDYLVENIGAVQSVSLQFQDGLPFGFCNFMFPPDAVNAVMTLNNKEIEGRKIYVGKALPKLKRQAQLQSETESFKKKLSTQMKGRNLYVRGFDESFTEDDLATLFLPFGPIESTKIVREPDYPFESRKFGFVCFKSVEDAQRCIEISVLINFRTEQNNVIFISLAQGKEERSQYLSSLMSRSSASDFDEERVPTTESSQNSSPAQKNYRHELVSKISDVCSQTEALALRNQVKKLSEDQLKVIVLNSNIWNIWREMVVSN